MAVRKDDLILRETNLVRAYRRLKSDFGSSPNVEVVYRNRNMAAHLQRPRAYMAGYGMTFSSDHEFIEIYVNSDSDIGEVRVRMVCFDPGQEDDPDNLLIDVTVSEYEGSPRTWTNRPAVTWSRVGWEAFEVQMRALIVKHGGIAASHSRAVGGRHET